MSILMTLAVLGGVLAAVVVLCALAVGMAAGAMAAQWGGQ